MKLSRFLHKEIVSLALKLLRFRKLGAPPKGLKPLRGETDNNLVTSGSSRGDLGGGGGSRPGSSGNT